MGKFRDYLEGLNEKKGVLKQLGDYDNPDYEGIEDIEDYVNRSYKEGTDFEWDVGMGDDTPNAITLYSDAIKKDKKLLAMIKSL